MGHALTVLTTSALILSAALVACSLGGGDDDDDSSTGGGSPGAGGSIVALTGGTANGLTGGASSSQGGGTSGASSSTGGSTGMPEECPKIEALSDCGVAKQTADIKVVNMMLVVDKSASMSDKPMPDQDSKWVSLGSALKSALGGEVQDQMNLGLILYPYDGTKGAAQAGVVCEVSEDVASVNVPIGPGTQTVDDIVRIVQDTAPSGGTPTAAALQAAYNYFTMGAGSTMPGNRYVLLATDGGPNCNYTNTSCRDKPELCTANLDAQAPNPSVTCTKPNCCIKSDNSLRSELCLDNGAVVDAITRLKDAGVTTYVVGIPGTEIYSAYLDQFAEASGQISPTGPEKYYAVSAAGGVESLTATFTGIVTQLVRTCEIPLDPPPDDPNLVNVAIDCELKAQGEPGAGWEIVGGNTLKLGGSTCQKVLTSGVKRVDLYYGCPPPK